MDTSMSAQCTACLQSLRDLLSSLASAHDNDTELSAETVRDTLARLSLWAGNIGALHHPGSPLSLELRLHEANDVLKYLLCLLNDRLDAAKELDSIVSGSRNGKKSIGASSSAGNNVIVEEDVLIQEVETCVTSLFRASHLIRQAAPTDLFAKALTRIRHRFQDQYDIAHVGEKYPKLALPESLGLRKRLGQAITLRRQYLSYIRDHQQRLDDSDHVFTPATVDQEAVAIIEQSAAMAPLHDLQSRQSTYYTKASTLAAGRITVQMLAPGETSDPEDDVVSYTTISRSTDGDFEASTLERIPKLENMRKDSKREFECPFCSRIQTFRDDRAWRRHVFSDLRAYICTFPDCEATLFSDINEWFRHEMQSHRVNYTCQFCRAVKSKDPAPQAKSFKDEHRYLDHIQRHHPELLRDSQEPFLLQVSRRPTHQIPAQDCPCCSDWVNRLQARAASANSTPSGSGNTIAVTSTVFKRHLASHLEQLALFAVPLSSETDEDVGSDMGAVENVDRDHDLPTPSFDSVKDLGLVESGDRGESATGPSIIQGPGSGLENEATDGDPLRCKTCSKEFSGSSDLAEHIRRHHPTVCEHCGRNFKTLRSVGRHISFVHSTRSSPLCEHCGRSFRDLRDVRRHISTVHSTQSHGCGVCYVTFTRLDNLKRHYKKLHPDHPLPPNLKHEGSERASGLGGANRYSPLGDHEEYIIADGANAPSPMAWVESDVTAKDKTALQTPTAPPMGDPDKNLKSIE